MGEDEFTPEELAILGRGPEVQTETTEKVETETDKTATETTEKAEETTETTETTKVEEEKENMVPQTRFNEVYGRAQELERKHDLLKRLGPEAYYKAFPDEAPEGWKPQGTQPAAPDPMQLRARYTDPSHPYNGMTLAEIKEVDPFEAARLYASFERVQERQKEERARKDTELKQSVDKEVKDFTAARSKDLYGKEPKDLTPEEKGEVEKIMMATLAWMKDTKRGGGIMEDAFFLMNGSKMIEDAKAKGAKGAIESLKKPGAASVDTTGGTKDTGFGKYEGMSRDQLAAAIDRMTEAEWSDFKAKAPDSLRKKLSDVF